MTISIAAGIIAIIALDQTLKYYAILNSSAIINTGVAFNLGSGGLAPIGLLIVLALLIKAKKQRTILFCIVLAATSNFTDRWRFDGVVDYLPIGFMRVNLADIVIVCLTAYLIYGLVTKNDTA